MGRDRIRYALWKGDKVLAIGTAKELAERFCVSVKTIRWWASPAARRRNKGSQKVAERI